MGGGYLLRHPEPPGVSSGNAHRYELSYRIVLLVVPCRRPLDSVTCGHGAAGLSFLPTGDTDSIRPSILLASVVQGGSKEEVIVARAVQYGKLLSNLPDLQVPPPH